MTVGAGYAQTKVVTFQQNLRFIGFMETLLI